MLSTQHNTYFVDLVSQIQSHVPQALKPVIKKVIDLSKPKKYILFGTIFGLISLYLHRRIIFIYREKHRYPPGLFGVPYFGSLLLAGYYKEALMSEVLPRYGPITMMTIGQMNILTIHDADLLEKMYKSDYCLQRPLVFEKSFEACGFECPQAFGNKKNELRRKLLLHAITYISNNNFIEPQLQSLLNKRIFSAIDSKFVNNKNGNGWYPVEYLKNIAFNIVLGAMFGESNHLDVENEDFHTILKSLENWIEAINFSLLSDVFYIPNMFGLGLIKNIIANKISARFDKEYIQYTTSLRKYFTKAKHETFEQEYNTRHNEKKENKDDHTTRKSKTLFQVLYKEIHDKNSEYYGKINDDMLLADLNELIGAGGETTVKVMECALMYIAKYSDTLQNVLYKELMQFCVFNRSTNKFEWNNKQLNKCIKFRAFIHEMLRLSAALPVLLPHSVSKTCQLEFDINPINKKCENIVFIVGEHSEVHNYYTNQNQKDSADKRSTNHYKYKIDESFFILANVLYMSTKNESFWGKNSAELNLDHWIEYDDNLELGMKFKMCKESMPFGIGKRICAGKVIAMKSLTIILANLIVNYRFESKIKPMPNITFQFGFGRNIAPKLPLLVYQRK